MNPANLTIGIEEEYLLLDPARARSSPSGQQVRKLVAARPGRPGERARPEPGAALHQRSAAGRGVS